MMRSRIVTTVVWVAGAFAAQPAAASACDGRAIGARFSEAARLCGGGAALTDATALESRVPVMVPETANVSVTMPGYRRRLAGAVQQVRRAGGTSAPSSLIVAIGQRYRIDPHLLASMVHAESAGRPGAVSNKGALGLMQVMPATARSLGVKDSRQLLSNPTLALSTGAAYLKTLQRRFGNNVPLVVAAYNAGPGAVAKYRGIPRYRETQGYVGKVMGRYIASRGGVAR